MRILVYEFVCGGGWYSADRCAPPASLLAEGRAMLTELATDFAALPDAQVDALRDQRLVDERWPNCRWHHVASAEEERHALAALAAAADWTVVIAPEFDGHLHERCRWVEQAGGRLLGPSPALVALTSDKHATAEHLGAHDVAVPRGVVLAPGDRLPAEFVYPAVLKPCDGAGSQGVCRVEKASDILADANRPRRLEAFCPGTAASVACLCGPRAVVPLVPCEQRLSDDGRFTYLGGSLPLAPALAARAVRLARRAVAALPQPLGYLGVDLVLGGDTAGREDFVIEINPRLTTSYVGLRALARGNLAGAMLALAEGGQVVLSWHDGPIQFESTGQCSGRPAAAEFGRAGSVG